MTADVAHAHAEAFRHMRYGTRDGRIVRSVWNSRDGVTPFVISDPDTGEELSHLPPWSADRYDPTYRPQPGDLVFIDLHPEKALQLATARVEAYWDHPDYPMSAAGRAKDEWVRLLWEDMLFVTHPVTGEKVPTGTPDLIVWSDQ